MTMRDHLLAVLRGPGAACYMNARDAADTLDLLLEQLESPSPDMMSEGYSAAYAADTGVDEVAEVVVEHAYTAMIRAVKDGK